jgi:NADPH:quinone reductase
MRAIVVRQFGDPKLLKPEEVRTPTPSANEAVIKILAAGINPSDIKNIQGHMHGTTLPRIPGRDFAGVVVSGPANLLNHEVWGTGGDIGFTRDGTHAQFILLPIAAITPKPKTLSMDAAGSAGLIFITAYSALVTAANVTNSDTVLIIGAAGGVGSAAVQIARSRGATVIGAVNSVPDIPRVKAKGAHDAINTAEQELPDSATVIFDTTGRMFPESVEAAAQRARLAIISAPTDGKSTFNLRTLYRKELRVLGVDTRQLDAVACAKLLNEMRPGFESANLKAPSAKPYPLSSASEAYDDAARGKDRILFHPNH